MADIYVQRLNPQGLRLISLLFTSCLPYSGDYSIRVPPLPIPNREVKPDHADGTASSGRVGSRRFFREASISKDVGAFCIYTILKTIPILLLPGGGVPEGGGGRRESRGQSENPVGMLC